jgi:hypothetical protein
LSFDDDESNSHFAFNVIIFILDNMKGAVVEASAGTLIN